MKNEKISKVKKYLARIRFEIIAMLIMTVMLLAVKPVFAIIALILTGISLSIKNGDISDPIKHRSLCAEDLKEIQQSISDAVRLNPFPLCMIDQDGTILWGNDSFCELFGDETIDGENIYDITGVKLHEMSNEELRDRSVLMTAKNKSFKVQFSEHPPYVIHDGRIHTVRLLHWFDNTANEALKKSYREERPCIIHINVDNLDDILTQAPDDRKSSLSGDIEKELRQWATRCQAAIIRVSKSKFVIVCDTRNLENNEANKFPILDEIREIDTGVDISASISIGIGALGKSLAQTEEFAHVALDLALGRGGDQAVVKKGSNIDYYGGKLQTVEKRNKGKSRLVAMALRRFIDQAPKVFVMGHKLPDMDSLGAALGVARMAKSRGKEVYVIIDNWDAVDMLYSRAVEENQHQYIRSEQAKTMMSRDDLLIVVDVHKPSLAECGEIIDMTDKVIVIDHHRRGEEVIQNPMLIHIEPYASSTSELVTEMIQYISQDKKDITKVEAEGLLAGIAVDTKNFSIKTGVRTFEAATWLRRQGADTTIVRQLFQTDMQIFKAKAAIITKAKKLPGNMAISYAEGPKKNVSVLISMAADELLNIKGMRATFVVGESLEGNIRVSARSLGDVNVQRIMETIGGGGNLTTAGGQFDMMSVEDVLELVEKVAVEVANEQKAKEEKELQKQNGKASKDTARIPVQNGKVSKDTGKIPIQDTTGKAEKDKKEQKAK